MKYFEISKKSKEEILKLLNTKEEGLNKKVAEKRLEKDGLNVATDVKKKNALYFIIQSFKDKFILILWVLAAIDYITSDYIGTTIIILLSIASAMLRFAEDYSTYRFNEKLKAKIKPKANVIRNGKEEEILQEKLVVGDIVTLSAGSVIPADVILLIVKTCL